ncbi:pdz/dhr/glgf [Akanthomyces lecanii RCEF 1005]|uniref:Pdz/dhr/glgf n=1 Tax=Akanthomyces lecanii RCEF 1005 TaxID=1081108 RepID=A0A168HM82_CORDF|nr:pdz/dhr/glgf [Akanthomyces lecanii RCEF 1005]
MAMPNYSILIQPHCDSEGLCRLSISLTLDSPAARKAHDVLCEFAPDVQGVPTHNYTKDNLSALDAAGHLDLSCVPRGGAALSGHVWAVERDTVGPVVLQLEVLPKLADAKTPVGPQVDLRRDQGGLLGSGGWFLPSIPGQERFLFSVEWDLSRVTAGTRACWSYGEGRERTKQEGPLPLLLNSLFMVGPVNSQRVEHGSAVWSTVYWFGDLPDYLEPVKDFSKHMVPYAYSAFEDEMENYSIFIRKSLKGYVGNNFASSLLLQYSDERGKVDDADLISILTHELMHNWLYLGSNPGESQNMWYIEGIAQFYAVFLPVRAGFRKADYFRRVMSQFLCAYYTNPLIEVPLRETEGAFYSDPSAQWTPYMRGFVYLLLVDASLRQASSASARRQNPIDDVVMSLTRRNRQGEQTTASTWLKTLYPLLGKEVADKQYQTLIDGGTLHLSSDFTFPVAEYLFMLRPVEQEVFELGFNAKSLRSGVVEGVLAGSRAALAGLQNGDVIQHFSRVSVALMDSQKTVSFSVTRVGQDKEIKGEFRPRSFDKVCSFQAVRVDHRTAFAR